ncbi:MAG: YceI family protein [Cellvibrionaceae bacterium]
MKLNNSSQSWGFVSQSFHWLIALLIFVALVLGYLAHEMDTSPAKIKLFILHKSIGITILALVILRFAWKMMSRQPSAATHISDTNEKLANLGQLALYGFMFAIPFTGWVVNTAANIPFKWMNLFAVPNLPLIQPTWEYSASLAHWYLSLLLVAALVGHIGMAVLHHIKHGSNVLLRMLPSIKPFTFFLIFIVLFVAAVGTSLQSITSSATVAKTSAITPSDNQLKSNDLAQLLKKNSAHTDQQWLVMPEESKLAFVGAYDGVPFDGVFKRFKADMYFDVAAPEKGHFNVEIDTGSITTYSDDWDGSLPDEDWFFISTYPKATYQANVFSKIDNGYRAHGVLSLKGISKPVALDFVWSEDNSGIAQFTGAAIVNRTHFNIGAGEWAADDTIAFNVDINVNLKLKIIDKQ